MRGNQYQRCARIVGDRIGLADAVLVAPLGDDSSAATALRASQIASGQVSTGWRIGRHTWMIAKRPASRLFGLVAHQVAHPLRPRHLGVVVVDPAHDFADLAALAQRRVLGAQGVVEDDDALGAALLLSPAPPSPGSRPARSRHRRRNRRPAWRAPTKRKPSRSSSNRPASGRPLVKVIGWVSEVPPPTRSIAPAGLGDQRDRCRAVTDDIIEVCLDRGGAHPARRGHPSWRLLRVFGAMIDLPGGAAKLKECGGLA